MKDEQPGERLRRWARGKGGLAMVDASPITAWDYLTQQRLEDLSEQIAEVKRWVMGLIAAVIGSALISLFR